MDRITLQNYRCFGSEEQSARLAPLTLLVGPNSTGKTSFLALIRALWDVAFREVVPNFREHPYDLGSWDDIVYRPSVRQSGADSFTIGFEYPWPGNDIDKTLAFETAFASRQAAPFPTLQRCADDAIGLELHTDEQADLSKARYRMAGKPWKEWGDGIKLVPKRGLASFFDFSSGLADPPLSVPRAAVNDANSLVFLLMRYRGSLNRPLSIAPVRSRPRRTYDPILLAQDAEGDYVPSYLANLARRSADEWQLLKGQLEGFGNASELFDEIQVKSFGRSDGDPFQIQVRKYGKRRKGPWRNLIDVGYGISQALPVLTELLRPDGPTMFLLQQPEVHLHPQAQAALGTLFCQTAAAGRQLIIETHSDYIIDRIRMDVRDGTTDLKPEDVSILYFEPGNLAVKIHSIRIDKAGNVLDAPEGYRQFFTDEMVRSIWA